MDLRPFMERWHMLPPSGGVMLVAVSGGRDSVCLLHYLAAMPRDFSVAAAHLDHGQRPTAAGTWPLWRNLCRSLDVPLTVERADVPALARERGVGLEEAGRMARYDFFRRTADRLAQRIATAHHAADQAETVVLNLVRGTGMQGLAGIPRCGPDRPASAGNLPGGHRDIPGSPPSVPRGPPNICRTAELLRQEDAFLDSLAADYLPAAGLTAGRQRLRSAPEVLRLRACACWRSGCRWGRRTSPPPTIGRWPICWRGRYADPAGRGLRRVPGETLTLLLPGRRLPPVVLHPGKNFWGEYTISVRKTAGNFSRRSDTIVLNCDKIDGALSVGPYTGASG